MFLQGDIAEFSAPVVFRSKALCADNGQILVKRSNAAAKHHRSARRVGLSASMAAFQLSQRTTAIRFESASPKAPTIGALNADRPTEPDNITLEEH